jgi:rubrerythrin
LNEINLNCSFEEGKILKKDDLHSHRRFFSDGEKKPKFCPNCGNKIEGNPDYCPECGHKL